MVNYPTETLESSTKMTSIIIIWSQSLKNYYIFFVVDNFRKENGQI